MNLTGYECELCMSVFHTKSDFLGHHMMEDSNGLACCGCTLVFDTTTALFQHKESHKVEQVIIDDGDIQFNEYTEEVEAVLNIPSDESVIGSTNELLYILDDSQCVNEVIIEESENNHPKTTYTKPDNFSVVQVDHGYMIPSVFKGQLETRKRVKKKGSHSESDDDARNMLISAKAGTSKRVVPSSKVRQLPVRKRHDVPDFSASDYVILNPNDEVDIMHYKCLRCEQLFINKFGCFRHVEKGKCYINSCDVCSADFQKNSEFYEHYILEHTDRAICNFCFRTFMYENFQKNSEFYEHYILEHTDRHLQFLL
ncbi:hypothetical protein QE152_g12714 [Popillia japonica]|uniref:C2H2-type domain-containing protein n=1 Tax=Popillia japonica TaxID=7064 RepID=A0AAW1LQ15_POPJA